MELSVLFIMAVIVLRGFLLEGYLISTGSMAPGLRGLHKHVACPSCGVEFAFGVTFDESVDGQANSGDEPSYSQTHAPTAGRLISMSPTCLSAMAISCWFTKTCSTFDVRDGGNASCFATLPALAKRM